jgi:metal-responsive CopG/Arc/MetJ family transcriptional regulator
MRISVDLPEEDVRRLDAIASRDGRSLAAEIREAVRAHLLRKTDTDWIDAAFGLWGDRETDGLEYQRATRAEWDRE